MAAKKSEFSAQVVACERMFRIQGFTAPGRRALLVLAPKSRLELVRNWVDQNCSGGSESRWNLKIWGQRG